jgi:hypothetical protein
MLNEYTFGSPDWYLEQLLGQLSRCEIRQRHPKRQDERHPKLPWPVQLFQLQLSAFDKHQPGLDFGQAGTNLFQGFPTQCPFPAPAMLLFPSFRFLGQDVFENDFARVFECGFRLAEQVVEDGGG